MRNYVVSTEFAALDRGFSSTMRNVSGSFDRVIDRSQRMGHAVRESSGLFSRFTAGAFVGNLLANGVHNLTGNLWELTKQTAMVEQGMHALFGEEKMQRNISFLRRESDRLGVSFLSTAREYNTMLASIENSGFSEKNLQAFTKGFMEFSSVMHLPSQETERAFYAIRQMIDLGKVRGQEVLQISNIRGLLPILKTAAKDVFGVTGATWAESMRDGILRIEPLLIRAGQIMQERYGEAAKQLAGSFIHEMARVENTLTKIGEKGAEKLFPTFAKGIRFGLEGVEAGIPVLDKYGGSMLKFAAAVIAVNTAMKIKRSLDLSFQGAHYSGIRRISEMTAEYKALTKVQGYGATSMTKSAATVKLFGRALASIGFTAAIYGLTEFGIAAFGVYDKLELLNRGVSSWVMNFSWWELQLLKMSRATLAVTGQMESTKYKGISSLISDIETKRGVSKEMRVMRMIEESAGKSSDELMQGPSPAGEGLAGLPGFENTVRVDLIMRTPPGIEIETDRTTGKTPVKVHAIEDRDLGRPKTQRYR